MLFMSSHDGHAMICNLICSTFRTTRTWFIAVYTEKYTRYTPFISFPFHGIKCEVSEPKSPRFYLGRKSLPILPNAFLAKTASNDSVLPVLLNAGQHYNKYLATSNPVWIKHNVRFLIILDELDNCKDLLSDDLGAWIQTKTRKKWYNTRCDKRGKV